MSRPRFHSDVLAHVLHDFRLRECLRAEEEHEPDRGVCVEGDDSGRRQVVAWRSSHILAQSIPLRGLIQKLQCELFQN